MLGNTTTNATLEIKGIRRPGVSSQEIESWMSGKQINIFCLPETRNNKNSRERQGNNYTWFFRTGGGRNEYAAGVLW